MFDNIFEAVAYNYPIFNIAFWGGEGDNIALDKKIKNVFAYKYWIFRKVHEFLIIKRVNYRFKYSHGTNCSGDTITCFGVVNVAA